MGAGGSIHYGVELPEDMLQRALHFLGRVAKDECPFFDKPSFEQLSSLEKYSIDGESSEIVTIDLSLNEEDLLHSGDSSVDFVACMIIKNDSSGKGTMIIDNTTKFPINVVSLDFSESEVSSVAIDEDSNRILSLNLSSCENLTNLSLKSCGRLLHLQLSFVDLREINVQNALSPLSSLLHLDVDNCNLSSVRDVTSVARTLTKLNASDNNFENFDDDFKEEIKLFQELQVLDLRENEIVNTVGNYRTTMLSLLPNLETLDNLKCKHALAAVGVDLRNDIEKNDETGNMSVDAIKEFDAALKGEADVSAVV